MKLAKRFELALLSISDNEGDDIGWALGYLNRKTAFSYMSHLKAKGLAYTHRANVVEVWLHQAGRNYVKTLRQK